MVVIRKNYTELAKGFVRAVELDRRIKAERYRQLWENRVFSARKSLRTLRFLVLFSFALLFFTCLTVGGVFLAIYLLVVLTGIGTDFRASSELAVKLWEFFDAFACAATALVCWPSLLIGSISLGAWTSIVRKVDRLVRMGPESLVTMGGSEIRKEGDLDVLARWWSHIN